MTEKIISSNIMNEQTKDQLIHELLDGITLNDLKKFVELKKKIYSSKKKSVKQLAQEYESNIIQPPVEYRDEKSVPLPKTKTVKQMAQEYEENIIQPPVEYRDDYKPIPSIRTKKTVKPTPTIRTKIEQTNKALKGYTSSYIISIKNNKDPLLQLQNTRLAIENHIKKALSAMNGIKFNETL